MENGEKGEDMRQWKRNKYNGTILETEVKTGPLSMNICLAFQFLLDTMVKYWLWLIVKVNVFSFLSPNDVFYVLVPPSIDFISQNSTVNETDDVTLFCNSTGNPRPNITWTFVSGPEQRDIGTGVDLALPKVNRSQAGTYQCTAHNNMMNQKTANVHVTINCE